MNPLDVVRDTLTPQGETLESQLQHIGFEKEWERAATQLEDFTAEHQSHLFTYGAAVAVSDFLNKRGFEAWETGGWAVFTHVYDAIGIQAVAEWRGSDDTDKDVFLSGDSTFSDVKEALDGRFGAGEEVLDESWRNDTYTGEKYVGELSVTDTYSIHTDIVVHNCSANQIYDKAKTVSFGDAEITVPERDVLLAEKLDTYNRNPHRAKDRVDIGTLLYLEEQEHGDDSIPALFTYLQDATPDDAEYNDFSRDINDLGDMLQETADHLEQNMERGKTSVLTPSQSYLQRIQTYE